MRYGFGDLQNYTTLKPCIVKYICISSFGDLQNYTTLKQTRALERMP